jgi:hypothetical protein
MMGGLILQLKKQKNMCEKIINIDLCNLLPFPEQEQVYGQEVDDNELIASIKERGIITPLIVAEIENLGLTNEYDETHVIISGHRRLRAAYQAGLDFAPCVNKVYQNYDEAVLDFLFCNLQREKKLSVRINEFLLCKQKLCQLAKIKQGGGTWEGTAFENEEFSRFWKTIKIDPEKPLNSIDVLKGLTGFSKYEQNYLNIIKNDDWLQKELDKLRERLLPAAYENELIDKIVIVRAEFDKEKVSFNEAAKAIKDLIALAHSMCDKLESKRNKAKAEKKEVVKKKPLEKMFLSLPVSNQNPGLVKAQENKFVREFKHEYNVISPLQIVKNLDTGWLEAMELTIPELCKCQHILMLAGWKDSAGCRIEYAIAKSLNINIIDYVESYNA